MSVLLGKMMMGFLYGLLGNVHKVLRQSRMHASSSATFSFKWFVESWPICKALMLHCYPLVNSHITMENHHAIHGKLTISMAIFNSKLLKITRGYTFFVDQYKTQPSGSSGLRARRNSHCNPGSISGVDKMGSCGNPWASQGFPKIPGNIQKFQEIKKGSKFPSSHSSKVSIISLYQRWWAAVGSLGIVMMVSRDVGPSMV